MQRKDTIFRFEIFAILLTMFLGTLFHFTFELSGGNPLVALFSSVNESTWEHLKLLFFPMLISTIIGYFLFGKNYPNFLCARLGAIAASILFTVIFFYTYLGILGFNIAFINIGTFYLATLFGEFIGYKILVSSCKCNNLLCLIIIIALFFSFIFFTFSPPKIDLFLDPLTKTYGIL